MTTTDLMMIWSSQPAVSFGIWLALIVLLAYLGRQPAHRLILSMSRALYGAMRLSSRSILRMEQQLSARNKEVILNHGRENCERVIEREFHRINNIVERDLSAYPALHRQVSDTITKVEEDFQSSTDSPPLPPSWLEAVEAITRIPRTGDSTVSRILDNIQDTIESSHKETLKAYQKSSLVRHKALKEMQPAWRTLDQSLGKVKETIDGLSDRAKQIDDQMQTYEQIRAGEDHAARMLTSSSMTQFFIAGLVLIIAILGGVINFQLIALPMSEMVGGTSQLGPMHTADVAALVIIMVEVAMGLFLMESLRITRLFPIIGTMDDKLRKRMMIITFSILLILASIESSLAYMRDLLALDREAITQSLSGLGVVEAQFRWVPSIGQMVMGFILPFALAFVAIPLESFIHASRTVLGLSTAMTLRGLAFATRMLGHLAQQLGKMMINLYDLIILLPLGLEQIISERKAKQADENEFGFDQHEEIKEKVS